MALNNMGLGFLFTARDLASGVMRKVQGNFNSVANQSAKGAMMMQAAFGAVGPALAIMGAGLGTIAAGFSAANKFGEFEQALAAVRGVTKATEAEVAKLRDTAIQAGIETQFSPKEATEGLLSLATAGQTAEQATQSLIPVLDLAAGSLGQLGVAEAAEAVVGTLNAYGSAADQAADVTDRLLRITQLTNFQTRDFSIGLSKAAAAGATFNQDLNDILISMGLLRNRNIDASSSATALRESLRRIGSDERAQEAIKKYDVAIFDAAGQMRSIIDITNDFAAATKDLGDEERNRAVVQAFGARGLLAFNAIQKASFTQVKNGVTTTYQGAEAIAKLREQMGEATGTAEGFKEKLLETYEGQKTLLKGTLETLGIVSGEGFAAAFKPIVSILVNGLNAVIKVTKATPTPIKQLVAGLVVFLGTFLAGGGAVTLLAATIALLIPALKIVAIIFAVVGAALLPLIATIGAAIFMFVAFREAFDQNVGGIRDSAGGVFDDIRLAFNAIQQLFAQGGFSGEVRKEMQKAENQGIRAFAIGVFVWVERIKNFFAGIVTGWKAGIGDLGPVFSELFDQLRVLWDTLVRLFGGGEVDPKANQAKWESWGATGVSVGVAISKAVGIVVKGLILAVRATQATVRAFETFKDTFDSEARPSVDQMTKSLDDLADSFGTVDTRAGETGEKMSSVFRIAIFGVKLLTRAIAVTAATFSIIATVVTTALGIIRAVMSGTVAYIIGAWKTGTAILTAVINGDWAAVWQGLKMQVFGVLTAILGAMNAMVLGIAKAIDAIGALAGKDLGATKLAEAAVQNVEANLSRVTGTEIVSGQVQLTAGEPQQEGRAQLQKSFDLISSDLETLLSTMPSTAEAESRSDDLASLEREIQAMSKELGTLGKQPIRTSVSVNLDEEAIGKAIAKTNRKGDALGGEPGASPQE